MTCTESGSKGVRRRPDLHGERQQGCEAQA